MSNDEIERRIGKAVMAMSERIKALATKRYATRTPPESQAMNYRVIEQVTIAFDAEDGRFCVSSGNYPGNTQITHADLAIALERVAENLP